MVKHLKHAFFESEEAARAELEKGKAVKEVQALIAPKLDHYLCSQCGQI